MWDRARRDNRIYIWLIATLLLLELLLAVAKNHPEWVEQYYSRGFYPVFSYLSIVLFSWIPFSIGDVFYALAGGALLYLISQIFVQTWQRNGSQALRRGLQLITLILLLHSYFYINWGLNYYRIPLQEQIGLATDSIQREEHLRVLDKYILISNELRKRVDPDLLSKQGVGKDLQEWMRSDTLFDAILSKSQIHGKAPISNTVASYFTVSGYFNPFTQEVHVNQNIPLFSYPFVTVHELLHQMGIGFEDECNFMAFRKLMDHEDDWYRYSAYYEAVQYLMYPLYGDQDLLAQYRAKLSPEVLQDMAAERAFWQKYRSWINRISGLFYNEYLKANNQPEGMERYSMMARLVVAWEKSQGEISSPIHP